MRAHDLIKDTRLVEGQVRITMLSHIKGAHDYRIDADGELFMVDDVVRVESPDGNTYLRISSRGKKRRGVAEVWQSRVVATVWIP